MCNCYKGILKNHFYEDYNGFIGNVETLKSIVCYDADRSHVIL